MRHRRHGRVLGRSPSHRKALLRNLASALILTERPNSELDDNAPKVKGRIITTLAKAKEVRPLVEKCVTIAIKGRASELEAEEFASDADRNTQQWQEWVKSDRHAQWVAATAPAVNARRRLHRMLGDKLAVSILFDELADRFEDRPGGYTRIMRLATPRLGDNGTRAILEFVGKHDRVVERSQKPEFAAAPAAESGTPAASASADDAGASPSTAAADSESTPDNQPSQ